MSQSSCCWRTAASKRKDSLPPTLFFAGWILAYKAIVDTILYSSRYCDISKWRSALANEYHMIGSAAYPEKGKGKGEGDGGSTTIEGKMSAWLALRHTPNNIHRYATHPTYL